MKKSFTLLMALSLVMSLMAMPVNPKVKQDSKGRKVEQQVEQPTLAREAHFAAARMAQMNVARPEVRKVAVKKNIARKAVRKAVMEETTTYTFSAFTSSDKVELSSSNFNITLTKGTSNQPAWNEGKSEARMYVGSSVIISSTNNITKVVYNYVVNASNKGKTPTIDGVTGSKADGTWDETTKTWTGSDTKVTMSIAGEGGNLGFTSITITTDGQGGGGGGGGEEVVISGLTQAYAMLSEDEGYYYWDFDLAAEFSEEGVTYPELYFMCNEEASSETSIVGTYEVYYAGVWNSAKDSVETDEDEAVGTMTVTYVEKGIYNFEGSFEGTDGKTYTWNATNVEVVAVDADNDYEEIELNEEGGSGSVIYEMDFTAGQGEWTIDNVQLPESLTYVWKQDSKYGMKATAFVNSTAYAAESWLISPEIDLTEATEATLKVTQALNKGANTTVSVKISTDGGKNWEDLDLNLPEGTSWDFQVDELDLSDYVGETIMIAFVYVSTTAVCPTWEIKDLQIVGGGVTPSTGDTVQVAVNYVQAVRYDSYSETGAYLWEFDAMNVTSNTQFESMWFYIYTAQNNRLEGEYNIESDNIYSLYGLYYYTGYTKVNGTDTTNVWAGTDNIELVIAYDEEAKAYDVYAEFLDEEGKTLYQFEVENIAIDAFNEEEVDITLMDSVAFVADTIAITGQDVIEFAYYPSYSEEGAYNYSVNLYSEANTVPYLALDVYSDEEGILVGTYCEDNKNVGEYCGFYPTMDDQLSVSNLMCTITENAGVYTVKGSFTGSDMNIYTFEVTATAIWSDGDYPYEPMDKQPDIKMNVTSQAFDDSYFATYSEVDVYFYNATDTIQLWVVSSTSTLADGTYTITTAEEANDGEMYAGYYSSYGLGGCIALIKGDLYYLVSGTMTIATSDSKTTITLDATSAHGTKIGLSYVIENPTGLTNIEAAKQNGKYILDGELYIQKNGVLYNAQGQIVK